MGRIKLKNQIKLLPNYWGFWIIIFLFLLLSLGTTIIHGGSIGSAIAHFGALFRYIPLASIILYFNLHESDVIEYLRHFKLISFVLLLIGYIEIIGGPEVYYFFTPLTKDYSSALSVMDEGSIFGIFANTVDYTYFLVISYILISNLNTTKHKLIIFFLFLIPIYFTGSKAGLIVFLICGLYHLENYKTIKYSILAIGSLIGGILIYQFRDILYWLIFIDAKNSRLGYIINTLPSFLDEFSFDTFFGVSSDKELVFHKINSYIDAPMMTWRLEMMPSFEDEFYVAIIVYYGIIGFLLLFGIYCGLYKNLITSRWKNSMFKYKTILQSMFSVILIAALFNQIIIIKTFSIFFWSIIGILCLQMKNCSLLKK
ncbi:MAG: hypothetical protein HDS35_06700 [Bacteroides sp.]|nr:hypothetical protein [Bacteroides sp.]